MKTFQITSSAGQTMGTYTATSPEAALDAMAQDAGYSSQADAAAQVGEFSGTVEELHTHTFTGPARDMFRKLGPDALDAVTIVDSDTIAGSPEAVAEVVEMVEDAMAPSGDPRELGDDYVCGPVHYTDAGDCYAAARDLFRVCREDGQVWIAWRGQASNEWHYDEQEQEPAPSGLDAITELRSLAAQSEAAWAQCVDTASSPADAQEAADDAEDLWEHVIELCETCSEDWQSIAIDECERLVSLERSWSDGSYASRALDVVRGL
jgi:hypothetical protein